MVASGGFAAVPYLSQRNAATVARLGGSARERRVGTLSWQACIQGGNIGCQRLGPVTLLFDTTRDTVCFLGEEQCASGMVELMSPTPIPPHTPLPEWARRRVGGPLPGIALACGVGWRRHVVQPGRLQLVATASLWSEPTTAGAAPATVQRQIPEHSQRVLGHATCHKGNCTCH